jgi:hypothetical protein
VLLAENPVPRPIFKETHINPQAYNHSSFETEGVFDQALLFFGGVVDGCGFFQHLFYGYPPEELLAKRFLLQAPGIERPQWANNTGDFVAPAGTGCHQTGVRKNGVDMHHLEFRNMRLQPSGQWEGELKCLAPLAGEKDRRDIVEQHRLAALDRQASVSVSVSSCHQYF